MKKIYSIITYNINGENRNILFKEEDRSKAINRVKKEMLEYFTLNETPEELEQYIKDISFESVANDAIAKLSSSEMKIWEVLNKCSTLEELEDYCFIVSGLTSEASEEEGDTLDALIDLKDMSMRLQDPNYQEMIAMLEIILTTNEESLWLYDLIELENIMNYLLPRKVFRKQVYLFDHEIVDNVELDEKLLSQLLVNNEIEACRIYESPEDIDGIDEEDKDDENKYKNYAIVDNFLMYKNRESLIVMLKNIFEKARTYFILDTHNTAIRVSFDSVLDSLLQKTLSAMNNNEEYEIYNKDKKLDSYDLKLMIENSKILDTTTLDIQEISNSLQGFGNFKKVEHIKNLQLTGDLEEIEKLHDFYNKYLSMRKTLSQNDSNNYVNIDPLFINTLDEILSESIKSKVTII